MSKSLARVRSALEAAGVAAEIREMPAETRTAEQAAAAAGCALDQIVKSILFLGAESGQLHLFLTAGGNQVSAEKAGTLAGEPLGRADAATVRARSGFAIGGVAPVGHLVPLPVWLDPRLMEFPEVWAAGGTPRHIFAVAPDILQRLTGARIGQFTA
ncbi:YbaK/EbsC family protein [Cereibacter sphaeroides]|uniref:YbaK/EbsC family protein n=1 Tax=Cereibacter sphaeroides TaxID=1063 RepID=UPI00313EBFFA